MQNLPPRLDEERIMLGLLQLEMGLEYDRSAELIKSRDDDDASRFITTLIITIG